MKLQPLHDKLFLRKVEDSSTSAGGIVIPDAARGRDERTFVATVAAVGPGRMLPNGQIVPPSVHVGDKVIAPRYMFRDNNGVERPADITIVGPDGETFYVVRDLDLYGVLTEVTP